MSWEEWCETMAKELNDSGFNTTSRISFSIPICLPTQDVLDE